jgi:hypothetical protein
MLTFDGTARVVWTSGPLAPSLLHQGRAVFAAIFWLLVYCPGPRHHARAALHVTLGPRPPGRHGAVHHCRHTQWPLSDTARHIPSTFLLLYLSPCDESHRTISMQAQCVTRESCARAELTQDCATSRIDLQMAVSSSALSTGRALSLNNSQEVSVAGRVR